MGEPVPIGKGGGSNAARYAQAGQARHVNAYTEETGAEGKAVDVTYAINGWELFSTLTNGGALRAMLVVESVLLAVAGRQLFLVTSGGVATQLGGIPVDGYVTMARNRKTPSPQVAIVCSGQWFIYEAGTLALGTDTDLPPPICVVEIDGYFVFIIEDGRFFIAGPNEGTAIDPLDFAEAEASSDKNVSAVVRGRTLIIFGTQSTQFWDPNGGTDFPFAPTSTIGVGCFAPATVAKLLVTKKGQAGVDTVMWAATDQEGAYAGVVALTGYSVVTISTPELDRLIRDEPDKSSLSGMAWTEDGIPFYAISGSTFTMVYNARRQEWAHRKSSGIERWNGACHAFFGGYTLFGHQGSNKLYKSLSTLYEEDGQPIIMQIVPPPVGTWPKHMMVHQLWADFITGVGLLSGNDDNDNPEVVFDYSKDGGETWGGARRLALGALGQRQTRVKLRRLGKFTDNGMTMRFTCSAAVVRGLQQLAIDAEAVGG